LRLQLPAPCHNECDGNWESLRLSATHTPATTEAPALNCSHAAAWQLHRENRQLSSEGNRAASVVRQRPARARLAKTLPCPDTLGARPARARLASTLPCPDTLPSRATAPPQQQCSCYEPSRCRRLPARRALPSLPLPRSFRHPAPLGGVPGTLPLASSRMASLA
jgi:hypothetical protein